MRDEEDILVINEGEFVRELQHARDQQVYENFENLSTNQYVFQRFQSFVKENLVLEQMPTIIQSDIKLYDQEELNGSLESIPGSQIFLKQDRSSQDRVNLVAFPREKDPMGLEAWVEVLKNTFGVITSSDKDNPVYQSVVEGFAEKRKERIGALKEPVFKKTMFSSGGKSTKEKEEQNRLQREKLEKYEHPCDSGTTCVVAVSIDFDDKYELLLIGSIGDSEAILMVEQDGEYQVNRLNVLHNMGDLEERNRVREEGGTVTISSFGTYRLGGQLAISRVIGYTELKDSDFKGLCDKPNIQAVLIPKRKKAYLCLRSDGTEQVSPGVIKMLADRYPNRLQQLPSLLKLLCLMNAHDDVSVMLLPLAAAKLESMDNMIRIAVDCDGNGAFGQYYAKSVCQRIPQIFQQQLKMRKAVSQDRKGDYALGRLPDVLQFIPEEQEKVDFYNLFFLRTNFQFNTDPLLIIKFFSDPIIIRKLHVIFGEYIKKSTLNKESVLDLVDIILLARTEIKVKDKKSFDDFATRLIAEIIHKSKAFPELQMNSDECNLMWLYFCVYLSVEGDSVGLFNGIVRLIEKRFFGVENFDEYMEGYDSGQKKTFLNELKKELDLVLKEARTLQNRQKAQSPALTDLVGYLNKKIIKVKKLLSQFSWISFNFDSFFSDSSISKSRMFTSVSAPETSKKRESAESEDAVDIQEIYYRYWPSRKLDIIPENLKDEEKTDFVPAFDIRAYRRSPDDQKATSTTQACGKNSPDIFSSQHDEQKNNSKEATVLDPFDPGMKR